MGILDFQKFASLAAYNSATKPTSASRISLVEATNQLMVDGVNVATTEPVAGDLLFLDGDGNKIFVKGLDQLVVTEAIQALTLVGYVYRREGRHVWIIDKNDISEKKYAAYAKYSITAVSSTSIAIKLRLSNDYNTDTEISVTLENTTLSAANAALIKAAIEAKCTEVSATNVPWAYYDESADKIVIVVEWKDYRQYIVSGTGCTIALSIWDDMPAQTSYLKSNCKTTNYRGILNIARAVTRFSTNGRTPTADEPLGVSGNSDPVTLDAFTNSEYCATLRATFSSYEDYIRGEYGIMSPQECGPFRYDAAELTKKYGNRTVVLADGTTAYAFPTLHQPLTVAYNSDGLRAGDWYSAGVEDGVVFMRDDVLAMLRANQTKMGTTLLTNSACRWFAQRYYVYNAWLFLGTNGNLDFSYVYYGFRSSAVALLEI